MNTHVACTARGAKHTGNAAVSVLRVSGWVSGYGDVFVITYVRGSVRPCMRAGGGGVYCVCVRVGVCMCMHVCVCVCSCLCGGIYYSTRVVRACVCACAHARVRACVRECVRHTHIIYIRQSITFCFKVFM